MKVCVYRPPDFEDAVYCVREARYNLWFKSCGGLYTSVCGRHAVIALEDYPVDSKDAVSQIILIPVKGIPGDVLLDETRLENG